MDSGQLPGFCLSNWKNRVARTEMGRTAGATGWEKRLGVRFWMCYVLMGSEQLGI